MQRVIYVLLVMFLLQTATGQCGTDEPFGIRQELKAMPISYSRTMSQVPLKIHIIQMSNGFGGIDSLSVIEEIEKANNVYMQAGIHFYQCEAINYIANSDFYTFVKTASEVLCLANDKDGALNVYFVPDLIKISDGDTSSLCGYAYMGDNSKDRVFMDVDCSTNGSTLLHEFGHYFSLYHTHRTSVGEELVDGSNCQLAGDGFCDTPADPKLSSSNVNVACVYTDTLVDANGDQYNPDARNLMSYSRKTCREHFSNEQMDQMNYYANNIRNDLGCWIDNVNEVSVLNRIQIVNQEYGFVILNNFNGKALLLRGFDNMGRLCVEKALSEGYNFVENSMMSNLNIFIHSEGEIIYRSRIF